MSIRRSLKISKDIEKNKSFQNLIFFGLAAVMIFAPFARGAVRIWSITLVEWVVMTLVFLWFWQMNNKSGWKFRSTKLDIPIWGFVILAIVSGVLGIYKYASVLDCMRLVTYVAVYYLVVNHFNWRLQLKFFWLIISIGTAISLLGIGQCFFGLEHSWWKNSLASTYVNHAHFAGYLEMAMALNLAMLFGINQDDVISSFQLLMRRLLLSSTLLFMVIAFVLSQSRGGWVALTIALLVWIIVLTKEKVFSKWAFLSFLLGIIIFIGFLGLGEDGIAYRMHTIEMSEDSQLMRGRVEVWESGLDAVQDNVVNGTGIGTFVWAFPKYRPEGFRVRYHYAHNDYIHMASEMGIMVIPLFLWGMVVLLKNGLEFNKKHFFLKRMMIVGCGIGVLSLIIHGCVDFNFHIPANMLVFTSLAGIITRNA